MRHPARPTCRRPTPHGPSNAPAVEIEHRRRQWQALENGAGERHADEQGARDDKPDGGHQVGGLSALATDAVSPASFLLTRICE